MDAVPLSGRCRLFWRAASEDEHEKVLFKFDIRHFDKNILEMSLEELRQHFGYKTSMRIRITILIRNIIWQTYEYIQAGSPPDFYRRREYIRALWYYIKKKTTQHRATQGNHYSVVSDQLLLMVKAGLFAYRDFNFRDKDAEQRRLRLENSHIILCAEKDSFIAFLEEMADLYGCHVITLGGSPSYFSNNTMVAEMHELGVPMDQEFMVFTIVDFDPAGWNAAEEFVKQLQDSGLRKFRSFDTYTRPLPWRDLCIPQNHADPKAARYRLTRRVQAMEDTHEWATLTGGVDGKGSKSYGIESDEFSDDLLRALIDRELTPHLRTSKQLVAKRSAMRGLKEALTEFLLARLLQPPHGASAWQIAASRRPVAATDGRRSYHVVPNVKDRPARS